MSKVGRTDACHPDGADIDTAGIEDLHTIVALIGDVNGAAGIHNNILRRIEVSIIRSRNAGCPHLGNESETGIVDPYCLITGVGDIEEAVRRDMHPPGQVPGISMVAFQDPFGL